MSSYRKRKYTAKDRAEAAKRSRSVVPRAPSYSRARTMSILSRGGVNMGRGPIPQSAFVVLKYHDSVASNGTLIDTRLNMNSIFSPRVSGGHQPLGRDQYASLYNRYRVWAFSIRLEAVTAGTVVNGHQVSVLPNNSTSAYTDFDEAAENPGAVTKSVPALGSGVTHIYKKWYLPRINGVTRDGYKDDRFQALIGASPSETLICHINYADMVPAVAAANNLLMTYTLNFYTELFDPVPLAKS